MCCRSGKIHVGLGSRVGRMCQGHAVGGRLVPSPARWRVVDGALGFLWQKIQRALLHAVSNRIESHRIASLRCSRSLREGADSNWEPLARIRAAKCDGLLKRVSAESTISCTAQKAVVERTALMRRPKGGRIAVGRYHCACMRPDGVALSSLGDRRRRPTARWRGGLRVRDVYVLLHIHWSLHRSMIKIRRDERTRGNN